MWVVNFYGTAEINFIFLMIPDETGEVLITGIECFHD
jgi:hypothetical protein